jgi:hypothetical protein
VPISPCAKMPKANYERHAPERSLLYQIIKQNWSTFTARCEAENHPVPRFVRREFEAYLRCGILDYGFARIYCQECRYDRLIAFSCKKRGFCGSCLAHRMSETSARLSDSLIPKIPTRQWVLSVPAPLRYLIAYDNDALKAVLSAFTGSLFSYLRKMAKRSGGEALDAKQYYPGAVTFIQRFGSALNLNVHMHSQVSDGAYIKYDKDKLRFIRIASPSLEEIRKITLKIARRVHRYLKIRMNDVESDGLFEKEPLLAKCYAASLQYMSALGRNSGKPLLRLISPDLIQEDTRDDRTVMGFNLHASEPTEADDRQSLERTLRYMGRPPLSADRLERAPDGNNLILTLKTPWRDGSSKILMTPFDLLERLVALIPPPRKNQIRYHGFFGPNAKLRGQLRPCAQGSLDESLSRKIKRPLFAKLMARVFDIDVLQCARCYSKMQIISFIKEPIAIRSILKSLKMSTAPPEVFRPAAEYIICYEEIAEPLIDEEAII